LIPEDDNNQKMKLPTTYKEQISLFMSRNLIIENTDLAEETLKRINYYRLTAYALTLKKHPSDDDFKDGVTFNKLLSLYEFDRKLRLLLLGALETIEIAFRSHISYEFSHKSGPLGYKDKDNFINEKFHKESLEELNRLIDKSRRGELFIEHHFKKYNGEFPIWAAMEVTSFGYLSKFYRNLSEDTKKQIAKKYYEVPYYYLESWLQTLSNVRNVCAHYGRLYNKRLTFEPKLFKEEQRQFQNKYIFAAVYIITRLLSKTEGLRMITELEALVTQYESEIEFQYIGFKSNWKEQLEKINTQK
jgi:abortive infection bacteriophage resistance protein